MLMFEKSAMAMRRVSIRAVAARYLLSLFKPSLNIIYITRYMALQPSLSNNPTSSSLSYGYPIIIIIRPK